MEEEPSFKKNMKGVFKRIGIVLAIIGTVIVTLIVLYFLGIPSQWILDREHKIDYGPISCVAGIFGAIALALVGYGLYRFARYILIGK